MAKNINEPEQTTDNPELQQPSMSYQSAADLAELIRRLIQTGHVPPEHLPPVETASRLAGKDPVTVAFPPCAGELLALIKSPGASSQDVEIEVAFDEYFRFGTPHVVINQSVNGEINASLLACNSATQRLHPWPSECCICNPCLTLDGNRNGAREKGLRRLFIGDLVWLFYHERMGIFEVLGKILDAYACNGSLPISNGSLDPGVRDDIAAIVLEVMTRQTQAGLAPRTRDRAYSYMRGVGWNSKAGQMLAAKDSASFAAVQKNTGFNELFHKFIYNSLEFFKDKRLADAIRSTNAPATPSISTLVTISDTVELLKKSFEKFHYGRNYYNALNGIVWVIAGMSVIRELRTTIGIPPAFDTADEYIPAAYDILSGKGSVTQGGTNRYLVHRDCARNARDILLDLEVVNHTDKSRAGELERWLIQIEPKIEAYRTAYRNLTGVDLGASATPMIEQQA